ncbi:MAG: molecular chaperone TorD family protein [Nitrospirae bacterium]|nr:molecular chaperone TorD family protein [Nitrospirota bacterium]
MARHGTWPEGSPLHRQTAYRFFAGLLLYPEPDRIEHLKAAARWLAEGDAVNREPVNQSRGIGKRTDGITGSRDHGITQAVLSLNGDLQDGGSAAGGREPGAANLADLQSDYVRFFRSSRHDFCYPYEGAYVDPEMSAALSFRLESEYAQVGVQLSVKDFPDHAATELEFMSYLCGLEARAAMEGYGDAVAGWRRREQIFLRDHLGRWFPQFARRVGETSRGFYRGVCAGAADFIASDKTCLERLTPVM